MLVEQSERIERLKQENLELRDEIQNLKNGKFVGKNAKIELTNIQKEF